MKRVQMRPLVFRGTRPRLLAAAVFLTTALILSAAPPALAGGHREAPAILGMPQVDGSSFFMFRSYEPGREDYVTLIADYNPLQDPFGGPNYFPLDSSAQYDIHVVNGDDATEDLTFRFRFLQLSDFFAAPIGPEPIFTEVAVLQLFPVFPPLFFTIELSPGQVFPTLNEFRMYTVRLIRGPVDHPYSVDLLTNPASGEPFFGQPVDNPGQKSFPVYEAYADLFKYDGVEIPGCEGTSRIFVGQRQEPFTANLGGLLDLVNIDPLGEPDSVPSSLANKNITSIAMEVPIACLVGDGGGTLGGWTTARLPRQRTFIDDPTFTTHADESADFAQVSRMGNPFVNLELIGLPKKNRFNVSHPSDDAQFDKFFTHPTLPFALAGLGLTTPTNDAFPRTDMLQVFRTGLSGINDTAYDGEMVRLNTAIPPVPRAEQNSLGVLGGDNAGWPNGRRPGDDVLDILLRVAMGALLEPDVAPQGNLPITDNTSTSASSFSDAFPYLNSPLPGSGLSCP